MQRRIKWIRKNRFKTNSKKKTWKAYKRFFLKKKNNKFMTRLKHIFNNVRIFKKHYSHDHITKSVRLVNNYHRLCLKKSTNKIYKFFHHLQFRIHLVLVLVHFVFNKIDGIILLREGFITINNKVITNRNYILTSQDILYFFVHTQRFNKFIRKFFILKVRKRCFKRQRRFRYKFLKRALLQNFFEINYRIRSLIYTRPLRNNELIKKKQKWTKMGIRKPMRLLNIFNFNLVKKFWAFT